VSINPALADFNIHPAKREARFRNPGDIHHAITVGLRDFCRRLIQKKGVGSGEWGVEGTEEAPRQGALLENVSTVPAQDESTVRHNGRLALDSRARRGWGSNEAALGSGKRMAMEALLDKPPSSETAAELAPIYGEPRYAGKVFGFFLLIEWGDKLFIIDQHAAHERILYDKFLSAPIPRQELLIPLVFSTETADDDHFLEAKKDELAKLAIVIERDGDRWRIDALPEGWRLSDAETVKSILSLRDAGENIAERWAATLCCHQAVRDGDHLDDATALALAKEALDLPDPHCPHGRPVWTEITREALCRAVRRN
jgi:DNA mismatch repair protein MutL